MTTYDEALKCVVSGDLETIIQYLQGEWEREEMFGKTDEAGRNLLVTASMLGRSAIVRELVRHGARVNEHTLRGYSALHLAACWGHEDTVKTLLELGANTEAKTFRGERPVDLARKYSKTDCVDCLTLAEAKQDLVSYIAFIKDVISHSERNITMEEKNTSLRVCSAKSDWIQSVKNATLSDFKAKKKDIEDSLHYILSKLSAEPAHMPATAAGNV